MPVTRIEKVVGGVTVQSAEPKRREPFKGYYVCHYCGSNMDGEAFKTLDEAAAFLKSNPGSGIRMRPGWSKVVDHIEIDGVPL